MRLFILIALTLSLASCYTVRSVWQFCFSTPRNPFLTQPVSHEPL